MLRLVESPIVVAVGANARLSLVPRPASTGGDGSVRGSVNASLSGLTVVSSGTVDVDGNLSESLDGITVVSSGTVDVDGNLFESLDGLTVSSEAEVATASDPLSSLSDDFSSGSILEDNGWSVLDTVVSSAPTSSISAGRATLTVAAGGGGGSFWFDGADGVRWNKLVSGACDFRARVEVTNSLGTTPPPVGAFRIAGIQVGDPTQPPYEYVHIGLGAASIGTNALEWKTTDNSDSAFAATPATLTGGGLFYDLRIVRTAADLQVFEVYARPGFAEPLASDIGWTLVQTIDRSDASVPVRTTFGGTTAVTMPTELQWGFTIYASTTTHNIQMIVDECIFATPS